MKQRHAEPMRAHQAGLALVIPPAWRSARACRRRVQASTGRRSRPGEQDIGGRIVP
jgi:hypothetical protein